MTAASIDIGSLIVSKPGVNGGRPCIAGTGMSVHQVAVLFTGGMDPDAITAEYPGISAEGVYAAITHYLANRAQIDAELAEESAEGRAALTVLARAGEHRPLWAAMEHFPPELKARYRA